VFAIMSVHHKNEIKNSGKYGGKKGFGGGGDCEMFLFGV